MQAALDERLADWSDTLAPQNPVEAHIVKRLVLASIRVDECTLIAAHLDHNHKIAAQTNPRLDRQIELRALTADFNNDPLLTRLQLLRTADGCRWLAQRWRLYLKHYTVDFNTDSLTDNYHALADLLGIRRDRRAGNKTLARHYKNLHTIANPDAPPTTAPRPAAASPPSPAARSKNSGPPPSPSTPSTTSTSPAARTA